MTADDLYTPVLDQNGNPLPDDQQPLRPPDVEPEVETPEPADPDPQSPEPPPEGDDDATAS